MLNGHNKCGSINTLTSSMNKLKSKVISKYQIIKFLLFISASPMIMEKMFKSNHVQYLIGWLNDFTALLLLLIFGLDLLRLFNCLVVKLLHEKISLQISLISKIVSNSAHNVQLIIFLYVYINLTKLFICLYEITVRSLDNSSATCSTD